MKVVLVPAIIAKSQIEFQNMLEWQWIGEVSDGRFVPIFRCRFIPSVPVGFEQETHLMASVCPAVCACVIY